MLLRKFIYIALALMLVHSTVFASCLSELQKKTKVDEIKNSDAKFFKAYRFREGKLLVVTSPWQKSNEEFEYLLLKEKLPTNICKNVKRVKTPVAKVVVFSTSHIAAIELLDKLESIRGVVDLRYVSNPQLLKGQKEGKVVNLGYPPRPEVVMSVGADVVMAFAAESPELEGVSKLVKLRLPVIYNADFREKTPLGRAEWIRFMGHFFDKENEADKIFNDVKVRYNYLLSKVKKVKHKPIILVGENRQGIWQAPGGESYLSTFIDAAGGEYVWKSVKNNFPVSRPIELIYKTAEQYDYWISFGSWKSKADLLKEDSRYSLLISKLKRGVYSCNKLDNNRGGNDYWETGSMRPDLVLGDFVKMIHPELKIDHKLRWFSPLEVKNAKN